MQRNIPPHPPVGLRLDFRQQLRRNHAVKVHGDPLRANVEACIVQAEPPVENAGDHVLPGVLLHEAEPAVIIDDSFHGFPHDQGFPAQVDHFPVFLPGVQHGNAAQNPGVPRLAAPLGVEGRGIQHYPEAFLPFLTAQHPGGEPGQMAVLII